MKKNLRFLETIFGIEFYAADRIKIIKVQVAFLVSFGDLRRGFKLVEGEFMIPSVIKY